MNPYNEIGSPIGSEIVGEGGGSEERTAGIVRKISQRWLFNVSIIKGVKWVVENPDLSVAIISMTLIYFIVLGLGYLFFLPLFYIMLVIAGVEAVAVIGIGILALFSPRKMP